jgi:guanosine-3',5'-bis(diphosphate) 3'-pyrophosphohydrolase
VNPEKINFTKLQNEAIQFIITSHWTQRRKGSVLPYIVHPIEVASFLGKLYPTNKDLILAGYFHDTLEDTEATPEAISNRFGGNVLSLVLSVTAEQGKDWQDTREKQLEKLKIMSLDSLRLKATDMLSNANSIAFDFELYGENIFNKFKGSAKQVRWYYRTASDTISERLGSEPF